MNSSRQHRNTDQLKIKCNCRQRNFEKYDKRVDNSLNSDISNMQFIQTAVCVSERFASLSVFKIFTEVKSALLTS